MRATAQTGQDVVEPAGPDVVGPAVPTHDPHAAPDQMIDYAAQVGGRPVNLLEAIEPPLQLGDSVVLCAQFGLAELRRAEDLRR
jgi:hypothetical protein